MKEKMQKPRKSTTSTDAKKSSSLVTSRKHYISNEMAGKNEKAKSRNILDKLEFEAQFTQCRTVN